MKLVHFVLDEAASLGHLESLDDAIDKYRGYGVRLQLYYQSLGQLKKCWPEGGDQTLLSNTSQVFFGVNDPQTAEYVSARLGDETIIVASGGTSSGTSRQGGDSGQRSSSYSSNQNDNWSQQARRLLKPEEVMALPERTAISFMPGVPPICTRLIRYYEKDFRPGVIRRALAGFKMFAAAAVMLLMVFIVVLSFLFAARSGDRGQGYPIDDPLQGIYQDQDPNAFQAR